ncbi:MAG TPA: OadG-related small transporter subunit [Syntrophales bacterium]|nr:OadG-related small transporter subunit [Syntrophales bacterium]
MDKFTFAVTMLIAGMGGTILTLGLMSLIMIALKKIFPLKSEKNPQAIRKEE